MTTTDRSMTVTLIDNYDSFTWNLWHYLGQLGCKVTVHRNDKITADEVIAGNPDAIVLSPGPCTPTEAGICCELIQKAQDRIPLFGVCLGHQAIGQVFGGDIVRLAIPMHGKISSIEHGGRGVFRGINGPFMGTRYHSLVVKRDTLPVDLEITAETDDGVIMGVQHKSAPLHGVQFHPELIMSDHGHRILQNFLDIAAAWNVQHRNLQPEHA
ncbi:aminodeoxychorismate/anthranilate synthase component II [Labrys miyagiensis]